MAGTLTLRQGVGLLQGKPSPQLARPHAGPFQQSPLAQRTWDSPKGTVWSPASLKAYLSRTYVTTWTLGQAACDCTQ